MRPTSSRRSAPARLLLLLFLLAAFALRLHELTLQDIWWDEARNIDVALRPFLQIATAPELDIHPPLYFWLLHGWDHLLLGMTHTTAPLLLAFGSRYLSVAAGVVTVALLAPLTRRSRVPGAALIAVALAACSPFWLAESQESRMYTVGFALLTAAAVAFLRAHPFTPTSRLTHAPTHRLIAFLPFILLSTAALLTHYNAVFILVAWYGGWGVWALTQPDRWRRLRTLLLCGAAMTLLTLPVAPIALRQIPGYANPNIKMVTGSDYLGQNTTAYLGGYAFDPTLLGGNGVAWLWGLLAVATVGVMGVAWRSRRTHRPDDGTLYFLAWWLVGGLALYFVAVLDRNAFNVRYASFVTPALYALIGIGFAGWQYLLPGPAPVRRAAPAFWLAVALLGLAPAVQADLYDDRFDREDIAGVTAWLRASTGPGDVIFVDQKYPFGFYYRPYTTDSAVDLPAGGPPPARYLFVDINTLDEQLNRWAGEAQRIFWVRWFESDTDPRSAVPFLLDKYGQLQGEQAYQGYLIQWWAMAPPTGFALAEGMASRRIAFGPAVETGEIGVPDAIRPNGALPVAIRWQRTGETPIDAPLKARVALYDEAGNRVAQDDERLLNDRHLAPAQWSNAESALNVYLVPAPPDLPAGVYSVRLLVYRDNETLAPLDFLDDAGNPAGQEVEIGVIQKP